MAVPKLSVNVGADNQTTVLVVHELGQPQHWTVGRASDCAVRVEDSTVSAHHLIIRAEPISGPKHTDEDGDPKYLWMFKDSGSSNGTYQGGVMVGRRGQPCPWIVIEGDDGVSIGHSHLRFDFDGHFTDQTTMNDAEVEDAKIVLEAHPPTSLWEFAAFVLTGPTNTHNWVWWLFLVFMGSLLVLAVEYIRHD